MQFIFIATAIKIFVGYSGHSSSDNDGGVHVLLPSGDFLTPWSVIICTAFHVK